MKGNSCWQQNYSDYEPAAFFDRTLLGGQSGMTKYVRLSLYEDIVVKKLVSFHYSELAKDYVYPGEKHNFWEFLYMDKGEAEFTIADRKLVVKQGELVFYSPNEFHAMRANRRVAPNVLIICFECRSEAMNYFHSKKFKLNDEEQMLLSGMLREGGNAFDVGKPRNSGIKSKVPRIFGAEQLVKLYLEMLLLMLVRKQSGIVTEVSLSLDETNLAVKPHDTRDSANLSSSAKLKTDADICGSLKELLHAHVSEQLKLDDISRKLNISKTRLKAIFKRETGITILEYHNRLKIDRAKTYIREENMNYTQIAEALGYSSIHYFSRHFKQNTDMTPSEYDKSLRARVLDKHNNL
jgi:AraC-like DNA-binding protein